MGLARFSIYKYVRTDRGWRYCKPALAANKKIKPNVVIINGKEEVHSEGAYYLLDPSGQWIKVGQTAAEAKEEQTRHLAKRDYERTTGQKLPDTQGKRELLADAIDAYLDDLELKVAGKSRQPKTLAASRQALREFAAHSQVKYLDEVSSSASVIAKHMAFVVQNSPTKSARTACNKFLLILQFLKHAGAVPMVGIGKSSRPLGLKDAPKYVESDVETYTDEELARFFFACGPRETAIFQTFHRAGLRENELATLRREDCKLEGPAPCLKVSYPVAFIKILI